MLRFGGFKATFHLKTKKKRGADNEKIGEPVCSAYRVNRDEFFNDYVDPTPRNRTPIAQKMRTEPNLTTQKIHSKSSNDIIKETNTTANIRQSMPDIAQPKPVPRISKNEREQKKLEKQQMVEQKKLEKQHAEQKKLEKQQHAEQKKLEKQQHAEQKKRELAEHKKREKLALQEQQQQEKVKREREKHQQRQQGLEQGKVDKNKQKKRSAPQPEVNQPATVPKPIPQTSTNYSTNTLESSISRSSGPPPYTAEINLIPNQKDNSGNTSFSTPSEDLGSWDIISQHREQLNRSKVTSGTSKQTHMDLNYNMVNLRKNKNSEA